MKIHDKILLAFLGLSVAIGIAAYVTLSLYERTLVKTVGNQSVELAKTTLGHVYDSMQQRMDDLQSHSLSLGDHPLLTASNEQFDHQADVNDLIVTMETSWKNNDLQGSVQAVTHNDLSTRLDKDIQCAEYYMDKYGYLSFGEVFVTNKYGINIAQTSITSDCFQGDEAWWQCAKAHGAHVGQIHYDDSAGLYAVDLATRLDDKTGTFAGVLKAVYNIHKFTSVLQDVKNNSGYSSTRLRLVVNDQVLFDTQSRTVPTALLEPAFKQQLTDRKSNQGYFTDSDSRKLVAFYSSLYGDYPDTLNAILLLECDRSDILAPTAVAKAQFIDITLMLIAASTIGGLSLAQTISKPLLALKNMAFDISCGDLKTLSHIHGTDEISQLAESFDRMARELKYTVEDLENKVKTLQEADCQDSPNPLATPLP
ncbi:MAG: HAMP domain-containing protein [Phycisphaerae bacterium]|nr:HAMP domain-containing protein [Phycisphaerae bacterium]